MATEQVLAWINNDLTLSQSIANFETDFSNGYLLGEIMHHYGQCEMLQFSKKKNKEAKVNNFYLVENCLRKLNVRFDGKLIHQIMEEERGASLRLLYQIKLACQKLEVPKDDPDQPSMTGLKTTKMHTILANKRDATLQMTKTIPPPTVGGKDIRTSKQRLADARTLGFEVAQKTLFDNALAAHQQEMEQIKQITEQQRTTNMQKLMENQTFMKEWMQEGKQNWRQNQQKRAEAIAKVKYFEDREVNIYKTKLQNELLAATAEEINGISDFDKNLQKLGIQQGISMEEAIKKQEEKKGIPPGQIQNFSYAATMNKIKETKKNSDFAGKERDRRRRKMIVDQQNAQTKLDQEAKEAALVAKLLAQTSEEQRDAFIDLRTSKCKQSEFDKRQKVASEHEERREQQNHKSELRRKSTLRDVQQERVQKDEQRRQEAKKAAFEKKMEKRAVNIEIASGLVDLILDVAEETFEVVSRSETHQIPNPEWRNFMNIFKSGKKVSLRNLKAAPTVADDPSNREVLQIPEDAQAHQMQKKFWSDPSMMNLYEYLSGSGAFNIPQLQPDLWDKYRQQYEHLEQDRIASVPFIDSKMQENGALVKLLDNLYKQKQHTSANDNHKAQAHSNSLLKQPNIKLALIGRAYSGKKTIAAQLKEVLGSDVAILNLDDMIREAIEYITPKKQDESVIVDPKAKGKKGAKEEPVHVDIFEGKNTVQYKVFAQQIKEHYFSGEALPRKIDLADFILDDRLLNGLVIERLKLQSEGKTPVTDEQIKAGILKEREIVKQLEELDAQAAQLAADPKAKPAKAAKGAPNADLLRAELEEIRSFKAQGWILVGYPQQLSQLKMLEHEMSGFSASIDQEKSERTEIKESWNKLLLDSKSTQVRLPGQETVASGFDSIIFVETPEQECIRRATGKEDDAGNESRIKTINESFDMRVGSLKKWCQQFGLIDTEGACKVTLNQEIAPTDWTNEHVKENVLASLKKVLAFKQAQFDSRRLKLRELCDQTADLNSQKPMTPNQSQKSLKPQSQLNSPGVSQIINDDQSLEIQNKTKSALYDNKSETHTNRSSKRTKQAYQHMYEINDSQKIHQWEQMLNKYFQSSLQGFNQLVKQRKRIFQQFGQTQTNFVNFMCREASYQKKVNDFCDNYNRFSEQYPELRGKEETRTELLKRVTILNDALWQTVLDRKTQAVGEHKAQEALMLKGWENNEKSRLVGSIAQLIENEFDRLRTVVQVVSGWVVNQDIDLKSLCKKLDERATSIYENGESPMLDQIVSYAHSLISQLFSEPCVKQQLSGEQLEMVQKERSNFHLRCNTLKQYAILLLDEINENTHEISAAFEQWIIVSVKRENAIASAVVKQIKSLVEQDAAYLEGVRVQATDLASSMQRVQLQEGQPNYLLAATVNTPRGVAETRMEIQNMKHIFTLFKSSAYQELLDSQTFLTLMIGAYQADRLPQYWRNMPFTSLLGIMKKFAASAPSNDGDRGKSPFAAAGERVQYINWKKLFVLMALASSSIPDNDTLQGFGSDLAYYGSLISLENFQKADAWFDQTESALIPSEISKAHSGVISPRSSTAEEDLCDQQRLNDLKELLWLTVKRTNEDGLRSQDLIQMVTELRSLGYGKVFGDLI